MPPLFVSDFVSGGYSLIEMHTKSDAQLLREYAEYGVEAAFTEIVIRHTDLVYSAALRHVASPDIAREVAQSVFLSLARIARAMSPQLAQDASLAGWLCRSARNVSLTLRRDELRRYSRERQAMEDLNTMPDVSPDWEQLRSVLDDAMAQLSENDYDALARIFHKPLDS
jgi:DNA-directed RNA polymerase specialized sigma24 family protein